MFSLYGCPVLLTICTKTLMAGSREHRDQIPYNFSRANDQDDYEPITFLATVRCSLSPRCLLLQPKSDISLDSHAGLSSLDRQSFRSIGSANPRGAFATSVPSDCRKALAALGPENPKFAHLQPPRSADSLCGTCPLGSVRHTGYEEIICLRIGIPGDPYVAKPFP
jgi:hypothetical protein